MILNLTQHAATIDQINAGVVEPLDKEAVQSMLTFDYMPIRHDILVSANELAMIALDHGYKKALIGGAPYLMSALENALKAAGITPVYAFSVRDSVEESDGQGGVKKVNVFRHIGFVEA